MVHSPAPGQGGRIKDLLAPFLGDLVEVGTGDIEEELEFIEIPDQEGEGDDLKELLVTGDTADEHIGDGDKAVTDHLQEFRTFVSEGATGADDYLQVSIGRCFYLLCEFFQTDAVVILGRPYGIGIPGCFGQGGCYDEKHKNG